MVRLPVDSVIINAPLSDLTPLANMSLTELTIGAGMVRDLAPLQRMPLRKLHCWANRIQELSPLRDMPLADLNVAYNRISDLSPLAALPLRHLSIAHNRVSDLTPLAGLPLEMLQCPNNLLREVSPLHGTPLHNLDCFRNRISDLTPLQHLPLTELHCGSNRITSLAPLAHGTLRSLSCPRNPLADLSALRDLPLSSFDCRHCRIQTFAPLAALPLEHLACGGNPACDLTPLHGLPLRACDIGAIPLTPTNLAVLRGLPLRHLYCAMLDPSLIPLLENHPTVIMLNGHRLAHVIPLLTPLRKALLAFRQHPRAAASGEIELRRFAAPVGEKLVLALPVVFSRADAAAFCQWQQGRLVCAETAAQQSLLLGYLSEVTTPEQNTYYHLGIRIDYRAHTMHWCSGVCYQWHCWQDIDGDPTYCPPSDPYLVVDVAIELNFWGIDAKITV